MRKRSNLGVLVGLAVVCFVVTVSGQTRDRLPRAQRANGSETLRAFGALAGEVRDLSVVILDDSEIVALGTVIREDGWVVTKASELGWQTVVRLKSGDELVPQQAFVDEDNDLAFLQIEHSFDRRRGAAESKSTGSRGKILVSTGGQDREIKMGILSADRRSIKRVGGALGVQLGRGGLSLGGVQVRAVTESSAAERAGIRAGDIISSVNGKVVLLTEQVQQEVSAHFPGDNVRIVIKRGEMKLDLDVVLGFYSTYFGLIDRNQRLSGATSMRLTGFEEILQHDIPVDVNAMGGPVLDLGGNLIGVNIARSDRVATFAIPIELVDEALSSAEGSHEESE